MHTCFLQLRFLTTLTSPACLLLALVLPTMALAAPGIFLAGDFGAKGDGKTDDTAAFQKARDTAAQSGGGTVQAGRGNFFFAGHLNVPPAVTLAGLWQSVPAHNGLRDRGLPKPTDDGTTFVVTEGAGHEDGPAFITLRSKALSPLIFSCSALRRLNSLRSTLRLFRAANASVISIRNPSV